MSFPFVSSKRLESLTTEGAIDDSSEIGRYFTDGKGLYRCVGGFRGGMGQMVGLEDCMSLDVILVPIGALHSRQLRSVVPAEQ